MILAAVLALCALLDQGTKALARRDLVNAPPQEFLSGIFRLVYAENVGAFLGLGDSLPAEVRFVVFTVLVIALLIGLAVFTLRMSDDTPVLVIVAVSLVIGGGLSNFIDRLANNGSVVDFMQLRLGPLRTGIFNVADVALMAGLALMLLAMFTQSQPIDDPDTVT